MLAMAEKQKLSSTECANWLRLIRSENVGPITFYRLLERFGTAAKALEALPHLAKQGGRGKPIKVASKTSVDDEIAKLQQLGANLIAHGEPDYPPLPPIC